METSIHPIPVLSPSFLYHPYIPSFKSKDFSFTCIMAGLVVIATMQHEHSHVAQIARCIRQRALAGPSKLASNGHMPPLPTHGSPSRLIRDPAHSLQARPMQAYGAEPVSRRPSSVLPRRQHPWRGTCGCKLNNKSCHPPGGLPLCSTATMQSIMTLSRSSQPQCSQSGMTLSCR